MQQNNNPENDLDEVAVANRIGRLLLQQLEGDINLLIISVENLLRHFGEADQPLTAEYRNSVRDQGLTAERIQQFSQFLADESLAGSLELIEVGKTMMRLDCNGDHVFCHDCVENWLAEHNTCPNCRHRFY